MYGSASNLRQLPPTPTLSHATTTAAAAAAAAGRAAGAVPSPPPKPPWHLPQTPATRARFLPHWLVAAAAGDPKTPSGAWPRSRRGAFVGKASVTKVLSDTVVARSRWWYPDGHRLPVRAAGTQQRHRATTGPAPRRSRACKNGIARASRCQRAVIAPPPVAPPYPAAAAMHTGMTEKGGPGAEHAQHKAPTPIHPVPCCDQGQYAAAYRAPRRSDVDPHARPLARGWVGKRALRQPVDSAPGALTSTQPPAGPPACVCAAKRAGCSCPQGLAGELGR